MGRILIAYYSRTGNTKKVAEALNNELACDIEEIQSVKSYAGMGGWFLAGKEGSKKVLAEIKPSIHNVADYDLVILGTPIWGWNISSPLRGYTVMNEDKFRQVAAFCTMGGNYGQTFEEIEKICGKTLVAKMAFKDKDVAAGNLEGIKTFLEKIK